ATRSTGTTAPTPAKTAATASWPPSAAPSDHCAPKDSSSAHPARLHTGAGAASHGCGHLPLRAPGLRPPPPGKLSSRTGQNGPSSRPESMAADASGNRGPLSDPLARLHPPTVTEKLVPVFARLLAPRPGLLMQPAHAHWRQPSTSSCRSAATCAGSGPGPPADPRRIDIANMG